MSMLYPLPPNTTLSTHLLAPQYVTKLRGSTKQTASKAAWSVLRFCWLHEVSGHGCWPHWLQPSSMCLGSMPWHRSRPIHWDGARRGASAILGKLVLHTFPPTVETDVIALCWLYCVCWTDLQPWPASHPLTARRLVGPCGSMYHWWPGLPEAKNIVPSPPQEPTALWQFSLFRVARSWQAFLCTAWSATAITSGLPWGRHEWQRRKPSAHMSFRTIRLTNVIWICTEVSCCANIALGYLCKSEMERSDFLLSPEKKKKSQKGTLSLGWQSEATTWKPSSWHPRALCGHRASEPWVAGDSVVVMPVKVLITQ